jgi:hypothetical protein
MSTATEVTPNLPRPSTRGSASRGRGTRGRGPPRGGLTKSTATTTEQSTDWATAQEDGPESSEEVNALKSKYASQLKSLKEIFPDWTAEDLVFALQEVDGDISLATDRIAGGILPQSLFCL